MDACFSHPNRFILTFFASLLVLFCSGFEPMGAQQKLSSSEAAEISREGYAFLYPLVLMDAARQQLVNEDPKLKSPGKTDYNSFVHARLYAPPSFRGFVRPNLDTLYSSAWVDLRHGPVIFTVPALGVRYGVVQILDMWAELVANMNRKTNLAAGGKFALVPQGWSGDLPEGVEVIPCSTNRVWVVLRLAANGPKDVKEANALQDQFKLEYLTPPPPPEVEEKEEEKAPVKSKKSRTTRSRSSSQSTSSNEPKAQITSGPAKVVEGLSAEKFFGAAAALLSEYPAPTGRWTTLAKLKQVGVKPGQPYDINGLEAGFYGAASKGMTQAQAEMKQQAESLTKMENGWAMRVDNIDLMGKSDILKATLASIGIGTPLPEDILSFQTATTESEQRLVGGSKYVLTFTKDELPPTDGFWTVTVYDQEGFLMKNAMERYSLGSLDKLLYNEDGSLTLYLQPKSPYGPKENNWLPTPKWGYFSVMLRLYSPTGAALTKTWKIPAVSRPSDKKEEAATASE